MVFFYVRTMWLAEYMHEGGSSLTHGVLVWRGMMTGSGIGDATCGYPIQVCDHVFEGTCSLCVPVCGTSLCVWHIREHKLPAVFVGGCLTLDVSQNSQTQNM